MALQFTQISFLSHFLYYKLVTVLQIHGTGVKEAVLHGQSFMSDSLKNDESSRPRIL